MTEQAKNQEATSGEKQGDDASMEQILQTIRGVISGDESDEGSDTDVLELTEVVKDDGSVESIAGNENKNVLEAIDEALDEKDQGGVVTEATTKKEEANENKAEPEVAATEESDENVDWPEDMQAPEETAKTTAKPTENIVVEAPIENTAPSVETPTKSETLLSEASKEASSNALKDLVTTVSKPVSDGLATRGGTTMEDIVIEAIKPHLKTWLDNNLPSIVKSLVEKEIKKLVPDDD